MNTQTRIIESLPRGAERRTVLRPDSHDWRVNPRVYEFLGTKFEPLTLAQTLERARWMTVRHGFRFIVTPNVDHIVQLDKSPELREVWAASWLSVCDSRILELLAKFSGIPLHAVPGSDLTQAIIEQVCTPDTPINLITGSEDVARIVAEKYGFKNMKVHVPPMGLRHKPDAIADCAAFVAQNPARYNFFCVGSAQQEMVAKACLDRGDCVGLGLCVGASFDFLAGHQSRAPLWMQKLRAEWLYRLLKQPRRLWKRYLVEGPKVFRIYLKWVLARRKAK